MGEEQDFTWHGADGGARRARVIGALAIAGAAASFGFLAGRISTVFAPSGPKVQAVATKEAAAPARSQVPQAQPAPAAEPPKEQQAEAKPAPAETPQPAPSTQTAAVPTEPDAGPPQNEPKPQGESEPRTAADTESKKEAPGDGAANTASPPVALINPGSADQRASEGDSGRKRGRAQRSRDRGAEDQADQSRADTGSGARSRRQTRQAARARERRPNYVEEEPPPSRYDLEGEREGPRYLYGPPPPDDGPRDYRSLREFMFGR